MRAWPQLDLQNALMIVPLQHKGSIASLRGTSGHRRSATNDVLDELAKKGWTLTSSPPRDLRKLNVQANWNVKQML